MGDGVDTQELQDQAGKVVEGVAETLGQLSKDLGDEIRRLRGDGRDPRAVVLILALAVLAIAVVVVGGARAAGGRERDTDTEWA